ncbi:hypothetical protein ABI_22580 [Asticcacaulis biprosthecium C19]|uniref:Uncharacterized protein n=1 Tax=Asticcacaulis biprosthecium C19 TaxID=715226 RepID=F4QND9_9CAUL|nr:hypothetical protein [Asticcacaulis biprosthecium]EGF90847.1 hypothetical protein ABI_22580 [Asticcacaulis biprosthecium C19]
MNIPTKTLLTICTTSFCLFATATASVAQDKSLIIQSTNANTEAKYLMGRAEEVEASDAAMACGYYIDALKSWDTALTKFREFAASNPKGDKARQATIIADLTARRADAEDRRARVCGAADKDNAAREAKYQDLMAPFHAELAQAASDEAIGDQSFARNEAQNALNAYINSLNALMRAGKILTDLNQEVTGWNGTAQKVNFMDLTQRTVDLLAALGKKLVTTCNTWPQVYAAAGDQKKCDAVFATWPNG